MVSRYGAVHTPCDALRGWRSKAKRQTELEGWEVRTRKESKGGETNKDQE